MSKLKPCPHCKVEMKQEIQRIGVALAHPDNGCVQQGLVLFKFNEGDLNSWNTRYLEDSLRAIVKEWETTGLPASEAMARVRDAVKEGE